jgi:hypothetical protein
MYIIKSIGHRKCTICNKNIKKDEVYFDGGWHGYRQGHSLNICPVCFVDMGKEFSPKTIKKLRDRYLLEDL